ncbi:hypothetical protein ACWGRJ_32825 [Bradyrhizobium sp. Lot11]
MARRGACGPGTLQDLSRSAAAQASAGKAHDFDFDFRMMTCTAIGQSAAHTGLLVERQTVVAIAFTFPAQNSLLVIAAFLRQIPMLLRPQKERFGHWLILYFL